MPRRDTKPLAKAILARFGSLAEAMNAPDDLLLEVPELGDAAVTEIKLVQAAALRLMRGEVLERPLLGSWKQVLDYCRAAMGFEAKEQFRILFLDKRNQMIADEVQQEGTVDHTPVYVREVVKRALELSATAIVLVHNHPSGDPTPSRADIEMTQADRRRGEALGRGRPRPHHRGQPRPRQLPRARFDLAERREVGSKPGAGRRRARR